MRIVKRVLFEIFDFFCGDWWILIGTAVCGVLAYGMAHWGALAFLQPASYVIYTVLLGLTLVLVMVKEAKKSKEN